MLLRINTSIIGGIRLFQNYIFPIVFLLVSVHPQISNAELLCGQEYPEYPLEVPYDADVSVFYKPYADPWIQYFLEPGEVLRYMRIDHPQANNHELYRVLYVSSTRQVKEEWGNR